MPHDARVKTPPVFVRSFINVCREQFIQTYIITLFEVL